MNSTIYPQTADGDDSSSWACPSFQICHVLMADLKKVPESEMRKYSTVVPRDISFICFGTTLVTDITPFSDHLVPLIQLTPSTKTPAQSKNVMCIFMKKKKIALNNILLWCTMDMYRTENNK